MQAMVLKVIQKKENCTFLHFENKEGNWIQFNFFNKSGEVGIQEGHAGEKKIDLIIDPRAYEN